MQTPHPLLQKLLTHYKEISLLGRIKAILDWDLNVNMPKKAAKGRADQSSYLQEKYTDLWLSKEFQNTLEKVHGQMQNFSEEEKAVIRNLDHAMKYYTKIPKKLLLEETQVTSEGFVAWREARETNQFTTFQPFLEKIMDIQVKKAEYLGYKDHIYDALLDQYEPELTVAEVDRLFTPLKKELTTLLSAIQKSSGYVSDSPLIQSDNVYPQERQKELILSVIERMGFDLDAGRMDISPHPFTTSLDRYDIRITNAYKVHDFRESYTAGMHETGHALYEQGINLTYTDTPLEGGVSLGIHEAMSRFWENMIGKNPNFLTYMTPLFQKSHPQLKATQSQEIQRLFNMVKPSFIRIEADEVTYALHIILRFEMERDLLKGKISVKEAPEKWRALSKELFEIIPDKDSQGILQDVHWAYGSVGYFPSYALGNLYGAQVLQKMKETVSVDEELAKGNLLPVKDWLDSHIHIHGSLYYPRELIKVATGEELNPTYFVEYLKTKYTKLYSL